MADRSGKHSDVTQVIIKAFYTVYNTLGYGKEILPEHEAQLLNYLRGTNIEVGLLMNFGPEATFDRYTFDNGRKGNLSWTRQSI